MRKGQWPARGQDYTKATASFMRRGVIDLAVAGDSLGMSGSDVLGSEEGAKWEPRQEYVSFELR